MAPVSAAQAQRAVRRHGQRPASLALAAAPPARTRATTCCWSRTTTSTRSSWWKCCKRAGACVVRAPVGRRTPLAAFSAGAFDLVLDGPAACRAWTATRAGAPQFRRLGACTRSARAVPIVALTANALAGDAADCLACGMNDYIMTKPVRPEQLVQLLHATPRSVAGGRTLRGAQGRRTGCCRAGTAGLRACGARRRCRDGRRTARQPGYGERVLALFSAAKEAARSIAIETRARARRPSRALLRHVCNTLKSSSATVGALALAAAGRGARGTLRRQSGVPVDPGWRSAWRAAFRQLEQVLDEQRLLEFAARFSRHDWQAGGARLPGGR